MIGKFNLQLTTLRPKKRILKADEKWAGSTTHRHWFLRIINAHDCEFY
jgi:hypothetical protein